MKKIAAMALCAFKFVSSDASNHVLNIQNGLVGMNMFPLVHLVKVIKNKAAAKDAAADIATAAEFARFLELSTTAANANTTAILARIAADNAIAADAAAPTAATAAAVIATAAAVVAANTAKAAAFAAVDADRLVTTVAQNARAANNAGNADEQIRALFVAQENFRLKDRREFIHELGENLPKDRAIRETNADLVHILDGNEFPIDAKNEGISNVLYRRLVLKNQPIDAVDAFREAQGHGIDGGSIEEMSTDTCLVIYNNSDFRTLHPSLVEQAAYLTKIYNEVIAYGLNSCQLRLIPHSVFMCTLPVFWSGINNGSVVYNGEIITNSQLKRIPIEYLDRCPANELKIFRNIIGRFTDNPVGDGRRSAIRRRELVLRRINAL
ncbi:hypothetical protein FACS1894126_5340 [Alphaproteobacteria bacterium]|nr:hypothetical protein FACS1894126_5340 [Alphaproteobacteria bacterium]